MKISENIQSLVALEPDFIGFIFYNKSPRYVQEFPKVEIPLYIKKVGVFVNETKENILNIVNQCQLDYVQLHGNESPKFCEQLIKNQQGNTRFLESYQLGLIKAFSIDDHFDFNETIAYEHFCDLFIFDTKGKNYGGNGEKFNWNILHNYKGKTPFLLSGGITKSDTTTLLNLKHTMFSGIDINSGFEMQPGIKNIEEIKEFKQKLA